MAGVNNNWAEKDSSNDALQYLQALKKEGRLDSIDMILLELHGGEPEGFVLVKGEKKFSAKLRPAGRQVYLIP